ncbi:MAG TPA: serpin family protein, partial [Pirellulales bacterium]
MSRKTTAFVLTLCVAAQLGCSAEPVPEGLTADEFAVVNGNKEFATELYAHLSAGRRGNLFFSPYSISSALAMAYAGAEGETAAQMAKVLHFPSPAARVHPDFQSLREKMAPGEGAEFQLRVANRLWAQEGLDFLPEFSQVLKTSYGAGPGLLDFRQSEIARNTINSWAEEQTDGKIQDLLGEGVVEPDARLVLTNAIYFKARWMYEFSKTATADAPFHISDSEQI